MSGQQSGISPHAMVSSKADIPRDCTIGPFTVVHDNVRLGEGSTIGSHCEIGVPTAAAEGKPLEIGAGSLIRSHSIFYEGSSFGARMTTGHNVLVREKITAGVALQIGAMSEFQGFAKIGHHVRTQSCARVSQHSTIGDFVWMFPYAILTSDPHPPSNVDRGVTIEDYAVITASVTVLPGVRIGARSLVSAHSLVNRDVDPDTVVGGVPAKFLCPTSAILHKGDGLPAYPWMRHFHRGYPPEVVAEWRKRFAGAAH